MKDNRGLTRPINWNAIEDPKDKEIWDRLVGNFWVPEKIALSNDLASWEALSDTEKNAVMKVFVGLTALDTLQGVLGATSLMEDAITPHEESVLANVSFMEAFAAGTELLTPGGWKAIENVTGDDLVCQYNPDDNTMSFVRPEVVEPHFSDEVYEIGAKNGNARQVVSGGHRVYFEEKVRHNTACEDWKYTVVNARELPDVNLRSAFRRFRCAAPVSTPGGGMTSVDRLLVAINADGSVRGERYTGEKTGTVPVQMTLHKERKRDRLESLLRDAGWTYVSSIDSSPSGERVIYRIDLPLEYVQEGRTKTLSGWWGLDSVSLRWAEEFIEEIALWDGHKHDHGHGVTSNTTSKEDNDFIVAVAALAGRRAHTTIRRDERSENYADSYVTYIPYTKDCVNAQSVNVERVDPQMVYCVRVPSTYLLTRNGASPVISGNCVHAKSYSNIFQTLSNTPDINAAFEWAEKNEQLTYKLRRIQEFYEQNESPEAKKIASTILESFLFFSGFYIAFHFSSHGKLTNTADIIRLIVRDEAVHGYYIGYKYQKRTATLTPEEREKWKDHTFDLLYDLYENELAYTHDIYGPLGLEDDVNAFLRYNANKALNNLGYEGLFPVDETRVSAPILTSLDASGNENHDFFSGSGSSYVIGKAEDTEDEDWNF